MAYGAKFVAKFRASYPISSSIVQHILIVVSEFQNILFILHAAYYKRVVQYILKFWNSEGCRNRIPLENVSRLQLWYTVSLNPILVDYSVENLRLYK